MPKPAARHVAQAARQREEARTAILARIDAIRASRRA